MARRPAASSGCVTVRKGATPSCPSSARTVETALASGRLTNGADSGVLPPCSPGSRVWPRLGHLSPPLEASSRRRRRRRAWAFELTRYPFALRAPERRNAETQRGRDARRHGDHADAPESVHHDPFGGGASSCVRAGPLSGSEWLGQDGCRAAGAGGAGNAGGLQAAQQRGQVDFGEVPAVPCPYVWKRSPFGRWRTI